MSDDLARMLDACLTSISEGESIETCLARYPHRDAELEPMLRSALGIGYGKALEAPRALRVAGRARLMNRIAARQSRPPAVVPRGRGLAWGRAMAAAFALATVSAGAVFASTDALPDEPLYHLKRAVESTQVALANTDGDRASLHLQFAQRRLNEEAVAARHGRAGAAEAAAKAYVEQVDLALNTIQRGQGGADMAGRFAEQLDRHQVNMAEVLQQVPEQARPAIQRAIEASQQGLRRALDRTEQRESPVQSTSSADSPPASPSAVPRGAADAPPEPASTAPATPAVERVDKESGKPGDKEKGGPPAAEDNRDDPGRRVQPSRGR